MPIPVSPFAAALTPRIAKAVSPHTPAASALVSEDVSLVSSGPATASSRATGKAAHRGKGKIALAVALTLSGAGVLSSLISPPPAPTPVHMSTLQKHVGYFDRNHDNQVTMVETYQGLRDMHMGVGRSMFSALVINGTLGPKTSSTWWSPTTIDLNNIHLAKHGSDTGIIDGNGQFVQAKYDEMWQKWDPKGQGFITEDHINAMRAANKTDTPGGLGSKAEFDLLMDLASEHRIVDGQDVRVLTRQTLADLYNGSLFYHLAGRPAPPQ